MRKRYLAFALISVIALVWILVLLGSLPQVDNPSGKPEAIADENRVPTSAYIELPKERTDYKLSRSPEEPAESTLKIEQIGTVIRNNKQHLHIRTTYTPGVPGETEEGH